MDRKESAEQRRADPLPHRSRRVAGRCRAPNTGQTRFSARSAALAVSRWPFFLAFYRSAWNNCRADFACPGGTAPSSLLAPRRTTQMDRIPSLGVPPLTAAKNRIGLLGVLMAGGLIGWVSVAG